MENRENECSSSLPKLQGISRVAHIKATAALLRSEMKSSSATSQEMTVTKRQPLAEIRVPNIIETARKLRCFEHTKPTETECPLSLTRVQQISYRPEAMVTKITCDTRRKGTTCERRYIDLIHSIEGSRREDAKRRNTRNHKLSPQAKAIISRVREFFEKLKLAMKGTCAHAIFDRPRDLTALACDVSVNTVSRTPQNLHHLPGTSTKAPISRKQRRLITLNKYKEEWGEVVKKAIHEKLKNEEDVTITDLHCQLWSEHENFRFSRATLHVLVRALGFSYKINTRGQKFIFERSDLVEKRSKYLADISEARSRGDCLIYMDETWIFAGMVKKRCWNDNNIPRFAPKQTFDRYSYGRSAGKNKGQRAIVIGAMAENGILPGCTKMVFCGRRDEKDDYHEDMDHHLFEQWLENSIPHMLEWAGERRVTLIIDNAPYHSRQLLKVPTARSTKKCISDYLVAKGVAIGNKSKKSDLLAQLQRFIASRGGLSAVRQYAVDRRCSELGINLIRLPPFHCFFNPIELCWGQMKAHLTKHGKTTDRLEMVKTRAVEWMANVPSSLTESWFRDARKQEDAARQKQHDDSLADDISEDSASEYNSEIDDFELEELESDLELEEQESDLELEELED